MLHTKTFRKTATAIIAAVVAILSLAAFALNVNGERAWALASSSTDEDAGKAYYADDYAYLDDENSVFQSLTWEEAVYLFQQEGSYVVLLGGSWCPNTTAVIDYINDAAKAAGVETVYNLDFRLDGTNSATHIRESNTSSALGASYNYLYGELVTRYLTNLNDWVAYKEDTNNALTYTNAEGEEVTVAKAQVPFLFIYNKDNTVNNAGDSEEGKYYPIVYGYEEMLYRDDDGLFTYARVNGQYTKNYVTDYTDRLNENIFNHIGNGENQLTLSEFTDADYIRISYNEKAGEEIFSEDDQINIETVTYKQLLWLLEQEGDYLILFGGSWCGNTKAVVKIINDYAVANDVTVYNFDTKLDGGYAKAYWGYATDLHIRDTANVFAYLYVDFVNEYLVNIETEYDPATNNISYTKTVDEVETEFTANKLQVPYFFAYNKDAVDEDGHDVPILAYVEKMYTLYTEREDYIYLDANFADYTSAAFAVIAAYAESAETEAVDIVTSDVEQPEVTVPSDEQPAPSENTSGSNNTGKIVGIVVGVVVVVAVIVFVVLWQKKKGANGASDGANDGASGNLSAGGTDGEGSSDVESAVEKEETENK